MDVYIEQIKYNIPKYGPRVINMEAGRQIRRLCMTLKALTVLRLLTDRPICF
jgi:hypothetical protein